MVPEDPEKAYYAVQRNAGCSVIFEVKRDGTNHEYLKVLADLMEWLQTPVAESELFQCEIPDGLQVCITHDHRD